MNLSVAPNDEVTYKLRFESDEVIVVDKPAHLVTQPGKGHESDSLLNGLFAAYGAQLQNLGKERDFGLLHRLDRETSGLLVVALRPRAYDALRTAFEERSVRKFYWALVTSPPKHAQGVIRKPIVEFEGEGGRGDRAKKLAKISASGKPAITAYRVVQASKVGALLECRPVTGRLHQVRLHLASMGCPVAGDGLYGDSDAKGAGSRLALHAHRLVFTHPSTGKEVDARSPFPQDLKGVLRRLGLEKPVA
jgi:23S rRNA pseudouridine1911/1915/1917 synthase